MRPRHTDQHTSPVLDRTDRVYGQQLYALAPLLAQTIADAIIRAVYGPAPSTSTPTPTDAGTPRPEETTEARQEIDQ
jgi:hypothetical protein